MPHGVWHSGHVDFDELVNHLYKHALWKLLWHWLHFSFGSWWFDPWITR